EGDHVSRLSDVERRLKVSAGRNSDRASGGAHVRRVDIGAGTLGLSGPDRGEQDREPGCQHDLEHERATHVRTPRWHVTEGMPRALRESTNRKRRPWAAFAVLHVAGSD